MNTLKIIDSFMLTVEYFFIITLAIKITGKKMSKRQYGYIFILSILLYVASMPKYIAENYESGLGYLIEILYILGISYVIHIFSQKKFSYSISLMFITSILSVPPVLITVLIIGHDFYDNLLLNRVILNVIVSFIFFLLSYYSETKLIKSLNKVIMKVLDKTYLILGILYLTLSFIPFVFNLISKDSFNVFEKWPQLQMLSFVILVILFVVIMYIKEKENKMKESYIEYLGSYNYFVESYYNYIRHWKHDFNNVILSYKTYIDAGDLEKAKTLNETVKSKLIENDQFKYIDELMSIKIPFLKGLFMKKTVELMTENHKIRISINTNKDVLQSNSTEVGDLIDKIFKNIAQVKKQNAIEICINEENDKWQVVILTDEHVDVVKKTSKYKSLAYNSYISNEKRIQIIVFA